MALSDNLISYYKLEDDAANTTVTDSEGSNTGVSSTNTSNLSVVGLIDDGFTFVGASSEDVDSNMNAVLSNSFSVQFWLKTPNTPVGAQDDVCARISGALVEQFGILDGSGVMIIVTRNGTGGENAQVVGSVDVTDNAWHHIVIVRSPTVLTLYVDGSPDGTDVGTYGTSTLGTSYFFAQASVDANYYTGLMDEIAFWNRELSSTEVTTLYNSGSGLAHPFPAGVTPSAITMGHNF